MIINKVIKLASFFEKKYNLYSKSTNGSLYKISQEMLPPELSGSEPLSPESFSIFKQNLASYIKYLTDNYQYIKRMENDPSKSEELKKYFYNKKNVIEIHCNNMEKILNKYNVSISKDNPNTDSLDSLKERKKQDLFNLTIELRDALHLNKLLEKVNLKEVGLGKIIDITGEAFRLILRVKDSIKEKYSPKSQENLTKTPKKPSSPSSIS